ncbi:MAG: GntR family transcriptional regulator [Opitutaceae bacterium]|jgi:DNA-binding LacI/PurR family transcriptional regulator
MSSAPQILASVDPAVFNQVLVEKVESPTFQIAARMRQMIKTSQLAPGSKLPATVKLAEQLSVDANVVQRALVQLVKEGLLVRTPRVGTFVAEPPKGLQRIAYYHRPSSPRQFSSFERTILTEINRIGHAKGFVVEVISDMRKPEVSAVEPHPELSRHARSRWIQGVVSASLSPEEVKWFNSLPIPHATISTLNQPHTFNWVREDLVGLAVRQLAARGCKKIGMIAPLLMHEDPKADSYQLGFYNGIRSALAKLGLAFNPDWLVGIPSLSKQVEEMGLTAFGFQAFNQLWDQAEKPDGLFIYPDTLANGALMALGMRSVSVPDQLKLVLHTNAEFPLFCPFPADRLVVKAADAADALIAHIRSQLGNRTAPPRVLQAHIEPHDAPVSV